MSIIRYCLLLTLAAGNFFQANAASDSCSSKHGFHVLLSMKPMFNAISRRDSVKNYLYSHNMIEFQYSYGKHQIGIGFDGNRQKSSTKVNDLPKETIDKSFSISPSYAFCFYERSRFSLYGGLAYFRNASETKSDVISQIEVVSESVKRTEEGQNLFLRFNYRFFARFSLEMEFAVYNAKHTIEREQTFTLNPLMNSHKTETQHVTSFAFPSNFSLKFSL